MITIQGLRKKFGSLQVLNDLTLQIPAGQATGIVGPNGSGKTTLIKHLLGLVKPDAGCIEVNGVHLNGSYEYRRHIGYMPQMAQYPENMKVRELIDFIIQMREEEPVFEEELIALFELEKEMQKPLRVLSGGTKQKAGALLALMFDPRILILDEPTAGLDPRSSYQFKQWIKREKDRGKTILLTTHIMSEIEELADHLILLVEGQVRYHGRQSDFIKSNEEQRLEGAVAKILQEVSV
ncbi:ABC transporter ATP-binding protein [Fodinibius salsisoli]|uniref:ABC transporter ATP-binding protein n=1 Tax=Fodinibius salsisoli TaxID=2820877 RepID=A0ABT3PMY7_9BACT|nr:ABC transporter ATP-binding protein [Fodinibius salsisoli]MCW9707314.1 ABC transporter ATP-binding protein [Fodinibius salsisoli]